jgi:hypothetical protein
LTNQLLGFVIFTCAKILKVIIPSDWVLKLTTDFITTNNIKGQRLGSVAHKYEAWLWFE